MNHIPHRLLALFLVLAVALSILPVGTSLANSSIPSAPQSSAGDIECPTTSSNYYLQGGMQQWDYDNPVRPAWNHADKNMALRGWTSTNALKDFVNYGVDDPIQPPQFATLFSPARTPNFTSTYQINTWNWAPSPAAGSPGGPSTAFPATILGLQTAPGEPLVAPTHGRNLGDPVGYAGSFVIFADSDSIALVFTRADSAGLGYVVHVDGICVDPNLLSLYYSLDNAARNTYSSPQNGSLDYNLPGLMAGQVFGWARGGEIRIGIADTGTYQDPRSIGDFWQIRPARSNPPPVQPPQNPTPVPPTAAPPTSVPPTAIPPTGVPPTSVPPTGVPPTNPPGGSQPGTPVTARPWTPALSGPRYAIVTNMTAPLLTWKSTRNAVTFRVQVDNDWRFKSPEHDAPTGALEFATAPLADGTYYWRVQGVNSVGGAGNWSATWRFTIDTRPPAVATLRSPVNAATTKDTTPTFLWRWQSDASQFQIQVATDAGFSGIVVDKTVGRVTSYTPSWKAPLPAGLTYFWHVRTKDAAGNWGEWSPVWSFGIQ